MSIESLKKRYFTKLTSNVVGFGIAILTQSIVVRALGPGPFGDYSFLTGVLSQIILFFDLGNLSAFFVKLSQRPHESKLSTFYAYFNIIGFILFIIGIYFIVQSDYLRNGLFPDQLIIYIKIAAFLTVLTRSLQILNNMTDALGLTVKAEKGIILQKIIGATLIGLLFYFESLDLKTYFFYQFITTIVLATLLFILLKRTGLFRIRSWYIDIISIKSYIKEFHEYTHPLFIGFLFVFINGIFDRWFLQLSSGSEEQGFYGLAFQMSTISTIFTGAMSMLIMREFSVAFIQRDISEMALLFRRYVPLLYSIAAYFSCFIAIQSDKVITIMGGEKFTNAWLPLTIMAFYPIHQTYGQLSGSLFLATGQTKNYAKINIVSVIFGAPLLYFLIASKSTFGFNLGATGLAIKMVIIQFVFVNVQLYFNSKLLNLNFFRYFMHQIGCVLTFLIISVLSRVLIENAVLKGQLYIKFMLSGIVYTIGIAILVYLKPAFFGIKNEDITTLISSLIRNNKKHIDKH